MKGAVGVLALCALLSPALAFYSSSDDVEVLTPANFNSKVIQSDQLWLIEFYAPWCGHCQSLTPEWKKAATALKGVVKIGAVDADEHKSLGGQYGVQGFPTIKVFGANKNSPEDYQGARKADGIVDQALSKLSAMVKARLSGRGGSRSSGGGGGSGGGGASEVVELTDANFDKLVLQSDDMWLIEFFAPWCGHCKTLEPHWKAASTQLKGKMKLGAVDATVHTATAGKYGIQGFPTIKYFPQGGKSDAEDYDGGRTTGDIVRWAEDKAVVNMPPPEVVQLVAVDTLQTSCAEKQLCIVAVLPHILDCQSDCRNAYIDILKSEAESFKKHPWGWVWTEGAVQLKLEGSLGIGGFGYPALAAVNSRKMTYASLRGPFSKTGIHEFLRDLLYKGGNTAPVGGAQWPPITSVDAWDGKDGAYPEEDFSDLDDIELEPLDDLPTKHKKSEL